MRIQCEKGKVSTLMDFSFFLWGSGEATNKQIRWFQRVRIRM